MIRLAIIALMIATPALAETETKSEAGTAFMERCVTDITDNRIAKLKRQVPDYAASLSDEELTAGGMAKAVSVCPCFLHMIGIDTQTEDPTPEDKVATVVAYLDSIGTHDSLPMPSIVPRMTRLCGERGSVLPRSWIMQ